jgi:AcrR family transcriptional regulator
MVIYMQEVSEVTHGEHEAAILEAARDLLAERGLAALSMRSVADRVGVSATALYHYFENKQDLVDHVVRSAFERFGTYLDEAIGRYPKGSFDRVRAIGEAYISFALENVAHFRVMFSIQLRDHLHTIEDLPGGGGYPRLRQCVIEAMEAGVMRRADPDLVSHFLWAAVHGVVTLALACRLAGCEGCKGDAGEVSPMDLFHAFGPLIRHGLELSAAAGAQP